MPRRGSLEPDIVTLGQVDRGGIPIGAFGVSARCSPTGFPPSDGVDLIDTGGVGGTLAGNALSVAACARPWEVLTAWRSCGMIELATRFTAGVQGVIDTYGLPWSMSQLGARAGVPSSPHRRRAPVGSRPRPATRSSRTTCTSTGQPRRPDHAVPLDGPHVPGHHRADVDLHTEEFTEVVAALVS